MPNTREKLIELIALTPGGRLLTAANIADHLIANGVTFAKDNNTVVKWIPVTERLPRCGERVLITEGNAVFEASLSISHKWVRCGIGWAENITHWMPLPQPPKEGDRDG